MADSHGDPEAIAAAAGFLKCSACRTLYHLGDICDSNEWKTADDCVDRVRHYGIIAVKGNNDHTLAADARGRRGGGIRRQTIVFLENLPLVRHVCDATLVHSRPFIDRLGLSAMIGTMGRREADEYFNDYPGGVLFRGHSHQPEIITRSKTEIRFSPLAAGQTIDLARQRPCIVTCGALTKGFVMIWDPGRRRLTCRTFR